MSDSVLVVDGVSKRYGDFQAVRDLSLRVPRGSIYGFLGPNGAGKTTTLRMILSIYEPSSGRIEVLGRASALEVRERIGYLPEEKGLYKKMKAREIVAYFGMLKGMSSADANARARELLERYGLGEFLERRCEALSKGMGQKVQVLASIVHRPEFVIFDEPFSGLDPVNQQVLEDVIEDLRKQGTTLIFSTHIMEHAERLCDRIVLIAKGQKLLDGTIQEARRAIPARLKLQAAVGADELRALPGVRAVESKASEHFELALEANGDPDAVLAACFQRGIKLRAFDRNDPGLRDVFLALVGRAQAQEEVA